MTLDFFLGLGEKYWDVKVGSRLLFYPVLGGGGWVVKDEVGWRANGATSSSAKSSLYTLILELLATSFLEWRPFIIEFIFPLVF